MKRLKISLTILFFMPLISLAQDGDGSEEPGRKAKRFYFGLYLGSYFANQYTSHVYDGYGFDINGSKNNFLNSLMYRRIVYDYGGGYGQTDLIAEALGVNPGDWSFNEGNMPAAMRYNPGVLVGFNLLYSRSKMDGIFLNVEMARINVGGNFSITLNNISTGNQVPGNSNQRVFDMRGVEQRMLLKLGYQRMIGKNDGMNFFYEGGWVSTFTKLSEEKIMINNLMIDLLGSYDQPGAYLSAPQNQVAVGIGMFAGIGLNFDMGSKWIVQILYSPTYENLYFGGGVPRFSFQQHIGLRAFM